MNEDKVLELAEKVGNNGLLMHNALDLTINWLRAGAIQRNEAQRVLVEAFQTLEYWNTVKEDKNVTTLHEYTKLICELIADNAEFLVRFYRLYFMGENIFRTPAEVEEGIKTATSRRDGYIKAVDAIYEKMCR